MKSQPIIKAGFLLFIFTAISIFFVSLAQQSMKERIKHNEEQLLIQRLGELVKNYDNNILEDKFSKEITLYGSKQTINIYPAKRNNQVFAYLVEHNYPNGYSGSIRLLTGIDSNNQLLGVRVIAHKETPGLGDKIETKKSNWIEQFKGLSLGNPTASQWKVKRDGGRFDAFTGATITPRAIVTATYQLLTYFSEHEIK
ncbi:electron transport complex subunit RsxG [Bathymodiolus septemdierum thioautotrophic gill symbiont]|uniref:Ion-translocating oxidoreductase complex subunit G n=1 Tax=endosymbiont of Bathymodiolus septemdierum str. Myojin knoll TaxID=1303921 RepID=A0A0P0USK1_9GAMM|nr:electron transport complex subunit RsxG [Bathymodiolus septemdierum thioautotrophic gill symbiont]BAS68289.1 electron transport complex protein RnfG [endosymbiont of Bathymodiolus septemdierum str. Myojin knoll]